MLIKEEGGDLNELLLHAITGLSPICFKAHQCIDVCNSMPHRSKTIAQCKNWSKPVIKSKERGRGGGGNGQLTACVGGRQEDIFIAGQGRWE